MKHQATFERFTIELPEQAVNDCSHSGACDDDVAHWEPLIDFSKISPEAIRAELKEYGAWNDDELSDDKTNRERIVWCAANNIKDEIYAESLHANGVKL